MADSVSSTSVDAESVSVSRSAEGGLAALYYEGLVLNHFAVR